MLIVMNGVICNEFGVSVHSISLGTFLLLIIFPSLILLNCKIFEIESILLGQHPLFEAVPENIISNQSNVCDFN